MGPGLSESVTAVTVDHDHFDHPLRAKEPQALGEGAGVHVSHGLLQLAKSHRLGESEEYLNRPAGAEKASCGAYRAFLAPPNRPQARQVPMPRSAPLGPR